MVESNHQPRVALGLACALVAPGCSVQVVVSQGGAGACVRGVPSRRLPNPKRVRVVESNHHPDALLLWHLASSIQTQGRLDQMVSGFQVWYLKVSHSYPKTAQLPLTGNQLLTKAHPQFFAHSTVGQKFCGVEPNRGGAELQHLQVRDRCEPCSPHVAREGPGLHAGRAPTAN